MNEIVESPSGPGGSWYLALLKPNCGQLAERNLLRQDFEIFSPKITRTRRHRGRFREELRALFPGYVFVRATASGAAWRAIGGTLGVQRLIAFGSQGPSIVPAGLVAEIRQRCDPQGGLRPPSLGQGDRIVVTGGPFSGLVGRIERVAAEQRIWILLDLLGGERRISLKPEQVALRTG